MTMPMPRKTRGMTTAKIVQAAREQRRKPTPAEKKLWEALRGRQLGGLKFRRQHPYDRFLLDMFCVEYQLEVEVDGGVHSDPEQAARDAERTEFLKTHGIRVLRFRNEEIINNLPDVLRRIVEAAHTPSPDDSGASPPGPLSRNEQAVSGEGEQAW